MSRALDKIKRWKKLIYDCQMAGAREYAISRRDGSKPIVNQHFTAGNQQRYGWPPLSLKYFLRKQKGILKSGRGRGAFLDPTEHEALIKTHQKELARYRGTHVLDKKAQYQSNTGIWSSTNLPMLVLFGDLQKAVTAGNATIVINGNQILITFHELPKYAVYHHEGDGVPKRSPVKPNEADRQQVIDAMNRFIQGKTGTGGPVPVSHTTVPGAARMA